MALSSPDKEEHGRPPTGEDPAGRPAVCCSASLCRISSVKLSYLDSVNLFCEFILGIRDIDSDADWNAYVEQMNKMGLEDFKALAEEYYGLTK